MRRIVLIIEYDGTGYVGWQVQPNGVSVQQRIYEAFDKLIGERPVLHGSGRTDSGVHAKAQTAHFDTECKIPADKFCYALNTRLPADIRIKASFEATGSTTLLTPLPLQETLRCTCTIRSILTG